MLEEPFDPLCSCSKAAVYQDLDKCMAMLPPPPPLPPQKTFLRDYNYTGQINRTCFPQVLAPLLMHLLLKTPQQGAQPALHCALSVEMEGVSGKFMGDCREDRLQTSAAVDDEAAERLWQVSAQLVGLP